MRRLLALPLVLAAALAVAGAVWQQKTQAVPIALAAVDPAAAVPVYGLGTVEARRLSKVGFEAAGTLVELLADQGDRVAAGAVLARLHTAEQRARLARAEAQTAQAQAAVFQAEARVDRAQAVLTQKKGANQRRQAWSAAARCRGRPPSPPKPRPWSPPPTSPSRNATSMPRGRRCAPATRNGCSRRRPWTR